MQKQRMKKSVRMGMVTLGEGRPKICVPVMGRDLAQITNSAEQAVGAGADILELRIDSMGELPDIGMAKAACLAVREKAGGIPVLFTMRTQRDGGAGTADRAAYEALLLAVAEAGVCEGIDCELSVGEEAFMRIVRAAHEAGVPVVGSSHEFGEIGDMERTAEWLMRQEALGADICKAAVMTHNPEEALEAALVMNRTGNELGVPWIGIAMGPAGLITRICAQCIGSCLTFGAAGQASAPGQIDAEELKRMIGVIHDAM